jgi:hypothetical protein
MAEPRGRSEQPQRRAFEHAGTAVGREQRGTLGAHFRGRARTSLALHAGRSNTAAAPAKAKARIVRRILAISRSGPAGARRRQQRHSVIAIREQSSPFASTEGRTLRLGEGK